MAGTSWYTTDKPLYLQLLQHQQA
ncbi:MAG: hypothetical protein AAFY76_16355 [Cyanobacteria bacterium J06649_11]